MQPPPQGAPPPPPAGGYGAGPAGGGFGPTPPPPPPGGAASPAGKAVLITLVVVAVVITMLGTLSVLAIFGVRKYIANAKTAEVRNTLGQMAKDSVVAYERERIATPSHRVCPSASFPVPRDAALVSAKKYQSSAAEWNVDAAQDAGFACLRFEMSFPQYYQYRYEATRSSFLAGGRGDLNGDGRFSNYTITGAVEDSRLRIEPSISETDPDE